MILFEDLPPEIIPIVVENVTKPQHLAAICLVSRAFHAFTVPVLYKRIFIYPWQREGKLKVSFCCRSYFPRGADRNGGWQTLPHARVRAATRSVRQQTRSA